MTEKPESVEALAVKVATYCVGFRRARAEPAMTAAIAETVTKFLRSHGIDPATMQPTEKQQPADDAHRERVRVALAELRAEAKRLIQLRGRDHLSFVYVACLGSSSLVSRESHGVLVGLISHLKVSDTSNWQTAHDAIARANNLPTLAEIKASECIDTFDCNSGDHADCCPAKDAPTQPAEPVVTDEDRELAKVIAQVYYESTKLSLGDNTYGQLTAIIARSHQAEREERAAWRRLYDDELEKCNQLRVAECQLQAKLTASEARVCELTDLAAKFRKNLLDIHEFAGRKMEQPATADAKGGS